MPDQYEWMRRIASQYPQALSMPSGGATPPNLQGLSVPPLPTTFSAYGQPEVPPTIFAGTLEPGMDPSKFNQIPMPPTTASAAGGPSAVSQFNTAKAPGGFMGGGGDVPTPPVRPSGIEQFGGQPSPRGDGGLYGDAQVPPWSPDFGKLSSMIRPDSLAGKLLGLAGIETGDPNDPLSKKKSDGLLSRLMGSDGLGSGSSGGLIGGILGGLGSLFG